MTTNNLRIAAALAAVASIGIGGGASVIARPNHDGPPFPVYTPSRSRMSKPGLSFAAKKHRRKIARASRRYNLRHGA